MIEELPVIAGSYADLIIVSMSYILIDYDNYNVYFTNFLAILKNIAPHITNMSDLSAHYLVLVFKKFTNPILLVHDANFANTLVDVMEIFERIMTFQFSANPEFFKELVRCYSMVLKLGKLKLTARAIASVQYSQQFDQIYRKDETKDAGDNA